MIYSRATVKHPRNKKIGSLGLVPALVVVTLSVTSMVIISKLPRLIKHLNPFVRYAEELKRSRPHPEDDPPERAAASG